MSKITFRADDDLVDRLEACDASKSEVMREALRTHLDAVGPDAGGEDAADAEGSSDASDGSTGTVDDALADRVDELISERLDAALDERLGGVGGRETGVYTPGSAGEVNVNVTLDAPKTDSSAEAGEGDADRRTTRDPADDAVRVTRETIDDDARRTRKTQGKSEAQTRENACSGCGEVVPSDHVYCPNCGEKQSHRVFCECGDELRTDWAFCPGCGRRTPAADVLNDP